MKLNTLLSKSSAILALTFLLIIARPLSVNAIENSDCFMCHSDEELSMEAGDKTISLFVDEAKFDNSIHGIFSCVDCHSDLLEAELPHDVPLKKVNCGECHSQEQKRFDDSLHGSALKRGDKLAPSCVSCHGNHEILPLDDRNSKVAPSNIPLVCGSCHSDGKNVQQQRSIHQDHILENYSESIHGNGLYKKGLSISATCTSCHNAHQILPHTDKRSSINPENIVQTCTKCHTGIYEKYMGSVHAPDKIRDDKKYPVCSDCHSAHTIKPTSMNLFKFEIMNNCGKCHQDISKTYFDTYHGKASKLGYAKTAKCHDCHGSHEIFPITDSRSSLSEENIVVTCQQCHSGATRKFTGYLTHATHHDADKYPWVFWTFWAMTGLLVFTFVMSGLHTLLWLPRSLQMRRDHPAKQQDKKAKQYVRFRLLYRILHAVMIVSFLTLAITGMILKFSYTGWAMFLSEVFGGLVVLGFLHRCAAVLMFGLFSVHLFDLARRKKTEFGSWKELLLGENTMLFTRKDMREFVATIKWYLGKGPRPHYGRWTYWEKFDYFAVFWGITIIGMSGLILWFPEFFTRFLPGWTINVATIIHSDEALLATGFIFTIHFFNTHFRPEKFPMDKVIFTGRTSLEELKHERPAEYESLIKSGKLEQHLADPLPEKTVKIVTFFAWLALAIGISIIVGIIYTMIFIYK